MMTVFALVVATVFVLLGGAARRATELPPPRQPLPRALLRTKR